MRTTQALTIAMMCGLALSFNASAKVVWDNEVTNTAFKVTSTDPGESSEKWTKPEDGTVDFSGGVIALDTDLTDPLVYSETLEATGAAIVSAHFAATANADTPALEGDAPQAALTVIASGADTNWFGLVSGNNGATWEKFTNVIPTVGEEYDIKIEFDLRSGSTKKIRYSVKGNGGSYVVLTGTAADANGWYANPQSGATTIQSVSFAGTGDITSFAGDTVAEMTPIADIGATTQTGKFDYTNGTLNVAITAAAAGKATLKVIDFATGAVKTYADIDVTTATTSLGWNLADQIGAGLVPGGTYGYELTITPTGDRKNLDVTVDGTFVAAANTDANWFWADASQNPDVFGGDWATTGGFARPVAENNLYTIDEAAKFNVTTPDDGTNNLTRVDANVVFESFVDGDSLDVEPDALGGFVAATKDNENVWMALTTVDNTTSWCALTGALAPEKDVAYVVRAEVSFLEGNKQVRYLVKKAVDTDFVTLNYNGNPWLKLADDAKDTLAAVELKGSGKLAKLEANITDRALAEVNGVKYYTMAEALAASEAGKNTITPLTDVLVKPTEAGTYRFGGNYNIVVDISALTGGSYTWDQQTRTLTVVTNQGATYLVW